MFKAFLRSMFTKKNIAGAGLAAGAGASAVGALRYREKAKEALKKTPVKQMVEEGRQIKSQEMANKKQKRKPKSLSHIGSGSGRVKQKIDRTSLKKQKNMDRKTGRLPSRQTRVSNW